MSFQIDPQDAEEIFRLLREHETKQTPVLILLKNDFHQHEPKTRGDYVLGYVERISDGFCFVRPYFHHVGRGGGGGQILIENIHRVVSRIQGFREWSGWFNPEQLVLIYADEERPVLYFGYITHKNVQRNVTADGDSAEVIRVTAWVNAPMYFGVELPVSKIMGVASFSPF